MKRLLEIHLVSFLLFITSSVYAQYPTDCVDSVIICGNASSNLNVSGVGIQELNNSNSCSSQENNSIWLKVSLVTNGTLGFTLKPNSRAIQEDYDFFVFGPNVPCNALGQAIRCSTTNPAAAGQSNNHTGMHSNSTDTSEGPGPDGDSFVKSLSVSAGDSYFIVIDRPIGNSGFTLEWTGTAEFSSPPVNAANPVTTPLDLDKCDTDFTSFDLDVNTKRIKGTQDVKVTYHLNETDATSAINPLSSPYTNISNPQKIVARITNPITGCFELADFSLNVNLGPNFQTPSPLSECDTNADGNSKNGRTYFNLESKNSEILNGQDPLSITISYHESMASATNDSDAGLNQISYYNAVPNQQKLFVRIEDASNKNCKTITTLDLVVNALPEAYNTSLKQCDEDGLKDGLTIFNLNQITETIAGNIPERSVSYYLTEPEAQSGNVSTIDDGTFENTKNPQLLYAKVTNDVTGCYSIAELRLEVSTTAAYDAQLNHCDDDGQEDGYYAFTLTDADVDVLNGLPNGLELFYYETYTDALLETNPLPSLFKNTTAFSQIIYARVENSNACYGISEVTLNVWELPNVEIASEEIYCLNSFPETITLYADAMGTPVEIYNYSWSTGETTSEISVNASGIYTVRITNGNGCFKDRTIHVLPSNSATITDIIITDASQNNTVTVIVTGEGSYEYALNTPQGSYQTDTTFENVAPGFYTVYIKDTNGCGITSRQISVVGFPKYFTPNNDGINDYWQVTGISAQFQSKTTIYIFNRMGKLLKQLNPLSSGWDGTYIGQPLAPDDYWYSIRLQDGRTYKGHFTLKR
ncbi:T9SS type B sorting domain-containing protein [Gelidibacter salicanalis]|uniref:T9SS type B sorting domain-containing protein n=1 Tax=Gelidibacter salicanalis TaxID=291193 RepID=A0A934NB92_9FLAO|nr:T9SS type B sorting domain-containing protein [Gelidibacter salicanalis]MBJ7879360.1 T9SS type B sorting domain-containing protein [Gelidibacter salicanalis]